MKYGVLLLVLTAVGGCFYLNAGQPKGTKDLGLTQEELGVPMRKEMPWLQPTKTIEKTQAEPKKLGKVWPPETKAADVKPEVKLTESWETPSQKATDIKAKFEKGEIKEKLEEVKDEISSELSAADRAKIAAWKAETQKAGEKAMAKIAEIEQAVTEEMQRAREAGAAFRKQVEEGKK